MKKPRFNTALRLEAAMKEFADTATRQERHKMMPIYWSIVWGSFRSSIDMTQGQEPETEQDKNIFEGWRLVCRGLELIDPTLKRLATEYDFKEDV